MANLYLKALRPLHGKTEGKREQGERDASSVMQCVIISNTHFVLPTFSVDDCCPSLSINLPLLPQSVRIFRPHDNAKRLRNSAERLMMTPFPEDAFVEAVKLVVADNAAYVPPFGTGGSLYIRPLLFGSGARIGLNPADEYTLLILVIPVGDYYKGGLSPVSALVIDDFDRAAPRGVGNVKVSYKAIEQTKHSGAKS